ncbi:MAG: hypothetical protein ACO1NO_11405 [Burkholderiaceae bacterium]
MVQMRCDHRAGIYYGVSHGLRHVAHAGIDPGRGQAESRPFGVIRTISDNANENAATDFMRFVKSVAARYAFCIVRQFCAQLQAIQANKVSAGT